MTENVSNQVTFGPFRADLRTRELWKEGIRLKLAGQPFQVLEILLEKPGQLVTRDELKERMWPGDTFVDFSHGLNAAVNKLREALSDSAEDPKYIETLPRRGYRFIGQIEKGALSTDATLAVPEPVSDPVAVPEPLLRKESELASPPDEAKRRRWQRPLLLFAGFGFVAIILFVAFIFLLRALETRNEEPGADHAPLRTATLARITDPLTDPAFSPDGTELAVRRLGRSPSTSGIFLKRLDSSELRQLTHQATDCCPAYSPDGKTIAFSRMGDGKFEILVVPSQGGDERVVFSGPSRPDRGEVAWSPDGKSLLFSENFRSGTNSILSMTLDDLRTERVTNPPAGQVDRMPAYSPDGQYLAFVRSDNAEFQSIYVQGSDGNSRKVTSTPTRLLGPPAWSADSQSILFASAEEHGPQLWRVEIGGGALPSPINQVGRNAWHPTVAKRGYRLAFQQTGTLASLWKLDLKNPEGANSRSLLTRSEGRNEGPQISPDGKRLAFMSDRSGSMEIWVSGVDGSNPVQLSALGKAGTPRWSPDCKWIAFDSDARGQSTIYVVNVDGGEPRALVQGNFNNRVPSWSHDGNWIYFASDRNQDWQIWKVPVSGGQQIQITGQGGFAAWESADGQTLYYSKTRTPDPNIWKVGVNGGTESLVSSMVIPRIWASWVLVNDGIYFVPESPEKNPAIHFYDFATQSVRRVAALNGYPFWLAVTADGKAALYDQTDKDQSTVMILENFR